MIRPEHSCVITITFIVFGIRVESRFLSAGLEIAFVQR